MRQAEPDIPRYLNPHSLPLTEDEEALPSEIKESPTVSEVSIRETIGLTGRIYGEIIA